MRNETFWVSIYKNKYSSSLKSRSNVPLDWLITTDKFKEYVEEVRKYPYKSQEYMDAKDCGIIATINGTIEAGLPKSKENITINPTICIDIDYQDNKILFDTYTLDDIKYMLADFPSVMYISRSVGYGLMVIHRLSDSVTKDNYIDYFNELKYIYKKNNIIIDDSCSNVNRLRYVSYDDFVLKNEIYEPYELQGLVERQSEVKQISNENIKIDIISSEFNAEKMQGPFYFGHSDRHYNNTLDIEVPLIKEVIHTLLCFYNKEDVKNIWCNPKFYCVDGAKWTRPNDVLRWIDNWNIRENAVPNKKVMVFLNKYCGFNLSANIEKEGIITAQVNESYQFLDNTVNIDLNGSEYLYHKKDDILNNINSGINLIVAGTGVGKTEFWNQLHRNDGKRILVVEPYNSIVNTKYNTDEAQLAVGTGNFIDSTSNYVVTNYVKFNDAVKRGILLKYDFIVIDECHLIGTQNFRAEQLIEFAGYVNEYVGKFNDAKVILQTATTSNEDKLFDITKTIIINKPQTKFVKIEYISDYIYNGKTNEYRHDLVSSITYRTQKFIKQGRKVFIYWGTGGIDRMRDIQKLQTELNNYSVAIYHKGNVGGEDLQYISTEKKMGKFDVLISSCYFSVGCDLNDEVPAGIIIIGNNPYQEDDQVIGRFRRSKNIHVNIITNKISGIQKCDTSKMLEAEIYNGRKLNSAKNTRTRSLLNKYSGDDYIELTAYIKCSKHYYSDLQRKLDFYETRGYICENDLEKYIDKNTFYYDIITHKNPTITLIPTNTKELLGKISEGRRDLLTQHKLEILNNIKLYPNYDIEELLKNTTQPKLKDWLEALLMLQHHYTLINLLEILTDEEALKLSKRKLNRIAAFKIKLNAKTEDKIESELIYKLIDIYDSLQEKNMIDIYIMLFYCEWCLYADENVNNTYDIDYTYSYPVYNKWKQYILEIITIEPKVRDYILNYNTNISMELDATYMFLEDILTGNNDNVEEVVEKFKNKYINKSYIIQFINNVVGNNKSWHKKNKGPKGKNTKSVEIDGKIYATVTEAAKCLGISRQALHKRLNKK